MLAKWHAAFPGLGKNKKKINLSIQSLEVAKKKKRTRKIRRGRTHLPFGASPSCAVSSAFFDFTTLVAMPSVTADMSKIPMSGTMYSALSAWLKDDILKNRAREFLTKNAAQEVYVCRM